MQRASRLTKELIMLNESPPPGISCWQDDSNKNMLHAQILGPEETAYYKGVFNIVLTLPERYSFEPPKAKFVTPIYHPNIDTGGRICLDTLKMPPQGAWKPSLNISSLLTTILLLISEPNPDDPLMADIAKEYKMNKPLFLKNAKIWTEKYATTAVSIKNIPLTKESKDLENRKRSSTIISTDSKKIKQNLT